MTDIIPQTEAKRIVARGREERAMRMAQGLKPSEEIPKMDLTPPTKQETREEYIRRCEEHHLPSKFKDSDQ